MDNREFRKLPNPSLFRTVTKWSILILPMTIFDPAGPGLLISPFEYVSILIMCILFPALFLRSKFFFSTHWSFWMMVLTVSITFFSLLNVLVFGLDFGCLKGWLGQYFYRFCLVGLVLIALSNYRDGINLSAKIMAYLNILLVVIGTVLILTSLEIDFFRSGVYNTDSPLARGILSLTIFGNPNKLARSIIITFPFAYYWSYKGSFRLMLLVVIINCLVLVSTQSRMNLLLLSFEMLGLFYLYRESLPKRMGRILVSMLVLIVLAVVFLGRMERKEYQYREYGTTIRMQMLLATLDRIRLRPLLGYGPDKSKEVINEYPGLWRLYEVMHGNQAEVAQHNTVLAITTDAGIPAGIAFIFFVSSLLGAGLAGMQKKGRSKVHGKLLRVSFLSCCAFFGSGMAAVNFGENIGWYAVAMMLYVLRKGRMTYTQVQGVVS